MLYFDFCVIFLLLFHQLIYYLFASPISAICSLSVPVLWLYFQFNINFHLSVIFIVLFHLLYYPIYIYHSLYFFSLRQSPQYALFVSILLCICQLLSVLMLYSYFYVIFFLIIHLIPHRLLASSVPAPFCKSSSAL